MCFPIGRCFQWAYLNLDWMRVASKERQFLLMIPEQSVIHENFKGGKEDDIMKKKMMSLLLAVALCLSLGIPALAAGETCDEHSSCVSVEATAACDHTPGSYISSEWKVSSKFDPTVYCYYNVKWDTCKCADCGTPYSYMTTDEDYSTHRKVFVENETGVVKGFTCSKCNFCSWKAVPGAPEVTA